MKFAPQFTVGFHVCYKTSVKSLSHITIFVEEDSSRGQNVELSPTPKFVQGKTRDEEARNKVRVHILVAHEKSKNYWLERKKSLPHSIILVKEFFAYTPESLNQVKAGI